MTAQWGGSHQAVNRTEKTDIVLRNFTVPGKLGENVPAWARQDHGPNKHTVVYFSGSLASLLVSSWFEVWQHFPNSMLLPFLLQFSLIYFLYIWKTKRSSICWFTTQRFRIAGSGPGQSLSAGLKPGFRHGWQGPNYLHHHCCHSGKCISRKLE